ncbi:hypothetical protein [Deinococcus wulumuqiensis]|uniref:hypothetical protein n=1 Tax=Deinococcus wulumuqiensis TaxID=980427 RepID=UPI00242C51AE|nr:hypothetical protein [Deinococcus wulumuqiensis]
MTAQAHNNLGAWTPGEQLEFCQGGVWRPGAYVRPTFQAEAAVVSPLDQRAGEVEVPWEFLRSPKSVAAITRLYELVVEGWVKCARPNGPIQKHWMHGGSVLCGLGLAPGLYDCVETGPPTWNTGMGACRACFSALIKRHFNLPFEIGDRVRSGECGMTLIGTIAYFFLDPDNIPQASITREWTRQPQEITIRGYSVYENDTSPHDWFRSVASLRPAPRKEKVHA